MSGPGDQRAVWRRVSAPGGRVLDLMHTRVTQHFPPHVHGEFAIGACVEGMEAIRFRGQVYHSAPGSVVILEPGEPHTGGPATARGFVYRVMYPVPELLRDGLAGLPHFPEPVVADPELAAGLIRVHAALSRAAEPLASQALLSWFLGTLVQRHAALAPGDRADLASSRARPSGPVAREVMARLVGAATRPPSLAQIAAGLGLSRYQVLRSFRDEVGMPPHAWLAQLRVTRARKLLETGQRPAEAAAVAGFADQAHLTRWFRRVVGVTPGVYAQAFKT
jgi:AraC-like DNA-binding protein